ncbi:hypothetical protein KC887_06800, partial [Candidatus Kaiserbacteria bacterium]|nr:hypothetical protein [Candidatus Kaiserbacteria bacterium]
MNYSNYKNIIITMTASVLLVVVGCVFFIAPRLANAGFNPIVQMVSDTVMGTGANYESPSITVTSADERVLVAVIHMLHDNVGAQSITSVTFGTSSRSYGTGTGMTLAAQRKNNGVSTDTYIYYLVNPVVGAGTVQLQSVTNNRRVKIDLYELQDIDQVNPLGATGSGGSNTSGSVSVSLTNTKIDSVLIGGLSVKDGSNTITPSGYTEDEQRGNGNAFTGLVGSTGHELKSTISASTWSGTFASSDLTTAVVAEFKQAPVPAGEFSGRLYSDHGTTPVTGTSYTVKAAVGTSTPGVYTTTTNSSDGTFSFTIPTSSAPTSWNQASSTEQNNWQAVAFGNGRFVAVSNSGTNVVMYSTDGVSWTAVNPGLSINPNDIVFANGRFDVVGGGTVRHMYSYDGVTWHQGTLTSVAHFLAYGEDDGVYVAINVNGNTYYSHDGNSWSSAGDISTVSVTGISYGNGHFVVTSEAATNSSVRMYQSADGISWSNNVGGGVTGFDSSAYGNNVYIAVTEDGNTDKIYKSTTGYADSWSTVTAPGAAELNYDEVRFVNGYFVAIANESAASTESIALSTDGITWTEAVLPELNTWQDIAYGNGRIVAVSSDGSSRVMYADMGIGPETPITVWVDGAPSMKATAFLEGADYNRGIAEIPLYQDTVSVLSGSRDPEIHIIEMTDMASYDSSDDSDILFTSDIGTGSTTIGSAIDFYIATGTVRLPYALEVGGDFVNAGDMLVASSTVYLTGTGAVSGSLTGSQAFNWLHVAGTNTFSSNASTTELIIDSGGTMVAPTQFSISGNYTNNGTFTHNSGTVVFDGTSQQTATGTLNGTSQFYNLILNNTSGSGAADQSLVIGSALTATSTFTMLPGSSAAFAAHQTAAFGDIIW